MRWKLHLAQVVWGLAGLVVIACLDHSSQAFAGPTTAPSAATAQQSQSLPETLNGKVMDDRG